MRYSHLPIFQKTYILTLDIYKITGNFKREYKYTLGQKLKGLGHELLELIIQINNSHDKIRLLTDLNNKLEALRLHFRLAFELKVISAKRLGQLNLEIENIGQQIGGWQKWAQKKEK